MPEVTLESLAARLAAVERELAALKGGYTPATRDWESADLKLLCAVALGTLPICIAGLALKALLEQPNGPFRSLTLIGCASIAMGLLLMLAEKTGKRKRELGEMGPADGLIVGLGQALALIPGCSRSGSTLTFALFLDMRRDDAARFSFLLSIPASGAAGVFELGDAVHALGGGAALGPLALGTVIAGVSGYASIAWLLRYLRTRSLLVLVLYRVALGLLLVALLTVGLIDP